MNNIAPSAEEWAARIMEAWQTGVRGIIAAGQNLREAKTQLAHGEFIRMVESVLPFGKRKAQMLMAIAADGRLLEAQNFALLPPSIPALYEISRLDDTTLDESFADGTITPDMERSKISAVSKQVKRAEKERDLGAKICALPQQKFGVIYADPPWRFEPYSRETGMDRAPENHYPTQAVDYFCTSLRNAVYPLFADDCVLFLWTTTPFLNAGITVLENWFFTYKSHCIWLKDRVGTGYWFRNAHEILLVGTRGNIPAPAPGTQFPSVIEGRVGRHSQKPECFYDMIEKLFPTLPKVELFARQSRDGWTPWGNEVSDAASRTAAEPVDAPSSPPLASACASAGSPPSDDLSIPQFMRRT